MTDELAAMADGDSWLYADLRSLEPHHRAAKERTDAEDAAVAEAVDRWAQSEVTRHLGHGCQPDATHCVQRPPTGVDERPMLEQRRRDLLALLGERAVRARQRAAERRVSDSP